MDKGKMQWIRLIDIFFLGPFMIYYAIITQANIKPLYAYLLAFFGATTILVNAYYYIKILNKFGSYLS
jgi:hypothetical protein